MSIKKADGIEAWYAISLALQLGFLVIVPIGGFIFLGIWADQILQSSPFLLLTGIVVGFGITVYETYHLLTPLIKNNHA